MRTFMATDYTPPPIRVDRVTKQFAGVAALQDITVDVGAGEVFGLLGPNGAGKTTLIRTILDIIKPDSGRVELFGRPHQPGDRDRIAYLPEERGLYPRQPVGAVLEYFGALKGMTPSDARAEAARWLDRLGLADAATRKVEQLSKGNQQKVQLAATLLARPAVVIFDEPLSGLDPVGARAVHAVIRDYAAAGHTVVLSTHQMSTVESLCTRILMIARGRAVLNGDLKTIKREFSSDTAVRVVSDADYTACPYVERVEVRAAPDLADEVHLREPASADDLLAWLVANHVRVERFERVSTPLEDIFIRVADRAGLAAAGVA
jgi:ABC-2 type transport system ATP-binding protein